MTPSEITLMIIAVAVLILVIFLAKFLVTACKTLNKVNHTLGAVQRQIDGLGHEPGHLIKHVSEVSGDIHKVLKCCEPLYRSISQSYECSECKPSSKSSYLNGKEENTSDTSADLIKFCILGLNLWQKYRKEK